VQSKLARFTKETVTLTQKAVVGNAKPAVQCGYGGYADWVIVSIHALKTYLNLPYRRLLDVLREMPRIARILVLEMSQLPDLTTVCTHAAAENANLSEFLRLSAELYDTGEIQAIDATGMDRIALSQHYAKRTNWQPLTRNLDKLCVLISDKGYDWELLRQSSDLRALNRR